MEVVAAKIRTGDESSGIGFRRKKLGAYIGLTPSTTLGIVLFEIQ